MAREGLRARTITLKLKTSKFEVCAQSPPAFSLFHFFL